MTHNRDIVPSVPLQIMGFHHIAREVRDSFKARNPATVAIQSLEKSLQIYMHFWYTFRCSIIERFNIILPS